MAEPNYTQEHLDKIDLAERQNQRLIQLNINAIERLETKLTSGVGVSGLFLKFASDLPSDRPILAMCKILAVVGLIACAIACIWGLFPMKATQGYVLPSAIVGDYFNEPTQTLNNDMLATEMATEAELKKLSSKKKECTRLALRWLLVSIVATGCSQVIGAL